VPLLDIVASSGLGSLLGVRHAFEPDHLAAMSTLVSRERSGGKAALLGMCWGIGHSLSLFLVGTALVVLRARIPSSVSDLFELAVAVMLIGLGARAIVMAARQGESGPPHIHRHGLIVHSHGGGPAHVHIGAWTFARRPLLIGAIHGLAGSGALTALVLSTLPSTAERLAYVVLFGIGSTVGMATLSGVLGWPLARLGDHQGIARGLSLAVGCLSTMVGVLWGYPLVARLI
jgi:hypothetical protein